MLGRVDWAGAGLARLAGPSGRGARLGWPKKERGERASGRGKERAIRAESEEEEGKEGNFLLFL